MLCIVFVVLLFVSVIVFWVYCVLMSEVLLFDVGLVVCLMFVGIGFGYVWLVGMVFMFVVVLLLFVGCVNDMWFLFVMVVVFVGVVLVCSNGGYLVDVGLFSVLVWIDWLYLLVISVWIGFVFVMVFGVMLWFVCMLVSECMMGVVFV